MNAECQTPVVSKAPEPAPPVGPGARLRKARETRELSVAQVAEQLKLKQTIIEALEADDYARLPSILFARGYLRSYARLLALPVAEVLEDFEQLGLVEEQPAVPKGAVLTHKPRGEHLVLRWGSALVFLVLCGLLVAWYQGTSTSELLARWGINGDDDNGATLRAPATPPTQSETVVEPLAETSPAMAEPRPVEEPEPVAEQGTEAAPSLTGAPDREALPSTVVDPPQAEAPPPPPLSSAVEAKETPLVPIAQRDTAVNPESPQAPSTRADMLETPETATTAELADPLPVVTVQEPQVSETDAGSDELVLELSDDSWAEVTDARGERLVYDLLKAGTLREVSGHGPFNIFLGNAPGVELRFNGEPVTNIRANSRGVARLTLGQTVTN